jgi:hypothetical protein
MENLRKLAEEKSFEYAKNKSSSSVFIEAHKEDYLNGFIEHAQLAAEDKKELLETLKYLVNCNTKDRFKVELPNSIFKAQELIKKHETI